MLLALCLTVWDVWRSSCTVHCHLVDSCEYPFTVQRPQCNYKKVQCPPKAMLVIKYRTNDFWKNEIGDFLKSLAQGLLRIGQVRINSTVARDLFCGVQLSKRKTQMFGQRTRRSLDFRKHCLIDKRIIESRSCRSQSAKEWIWCASAKYLHSGRF